MPKTFDLIRLILRMMRTEDRDLLWCCSSCNGMADNASLFVENRELISCDLNIHIILDGLDFMFGKMFQ